MSEHSQTLILTALMLLIGRELRRQPKDEKFNKIAMEWLDNCEKRADLLKKETQKIQ